MTDLQTTIREIERQSDDQVVDHIMGRAVTRRELRAAFDAHDLREVVGG